jgi:hypothetical protein
VRGLKLRSASNSLDSWSLSSFRWSSRFGQPRDRARLSTSRSSRSGIRWRGPETLAPPAASSDRGGSGALGVAVAGVERLAAGARPRQAGHRARLAPTRVPPVVDVEESPPYGSSSRSPRGPRVDSSNGRRESASMRAVAVKPSY